MAQSQRLGRATSLLALVTLVAALARADEGLPSTPAELLAEIHQLDQRLIDAAQTAWQRSPTQAVRDYAVMLMDDQRETDRVVGRLATELGLRLPEARPDARTRALRSASGHRFDHLFLAMVEDEQRRAIASLVPAHDRVDDPGCKILVENLQRQLEKHRQTGAGVERDLPGTPRSPR
jgi:predicted outer membrane protein